MSHRPPGALVLADEPPTLTLHLLGQFRVALGPDVIRDQAWRLRKTKTLVKLLALAPGHQLHREQLLELLWPGLRPEDAAHNLHQTLYVARRTLQPRGKRDRYLVLQDEAVLLSPAAPLWVDVDAFEAAVENARRHKTGEAYEAALDLYGGDLLPEDRYDDQIDRRRGALRAEQHALLLALATLEEAQGRYERAQASLQRLIQSDPAHEEAQRSLMRVYALNGHRQQALRQYQILSEALKREVEAEPDPDTERLYDDIVHNRLPAGEPAAPLLPRSMGAIPFPSPAPRAAEPKVAQQTNLPEPLASFVGREHERTEVKRLLATTRLLTLVGSGGCGKTRLALQVAAEISQEVPPAKPYRDGVWLVELADLNEPSLVPHTVAAALNIVEPGGSTVMDALRDQLKARSLLLVLDNCEHLVQACAQLCDSLLRACPDLKILATSREPLRILGELTWRVPSLSLPLSPLKGDRRRAPADAGQFDAIRLFVERARAVDHAFALSEANAPLVTQICARLDGIPLAIELAASRVGTLSLEQIAARLDDAFRLLTGGSRTALARQQTLRALMDWSYELLSESERVLWRRLAVFAGTFSLNAAEYVCSDKDIKDEARVSSPLAPRQTGFILHPSGVVELLSQLVNKSLVLAEPAESDVRYRLLQTVRQYAFEKLSAAGEDHLLRERHRRFYLALVEKAEPALLGPAQATELKRLETEYDNLLAALTWSKQASDRHDDDASEHAAALAQLCGALWSLWYARGSLNEGRQWLADVLARRPLLDEQSHAALVKVLAGAGALAWSQGDYVHAQAYSSESLALSETAEHPTSMTVAALTVLGIIAQDQGDYVRATIVHEESLRLMRAAGHAFGTGLTLNALGNLARLQGDYARAFSLLDEALGIQRANGDQWGAALSSHNMAQVAFDQGDTARARTLGDEALRSFRALSNTWGTAVALFNLAEVALREQDAPAARQLSSEALGLYEALDDKVGRGRTLHLLGQALWASGDRPGALRVWRESLQVRHQVGDKLGMVTILEQFAAAADGEGDCARAARLFGAAEALQQSITIAHPPAARTDPSGSIAQARMQCSAPEWQSAWAVGRALSLDEVVGFALNEARPA